MVKKNLDITPEYVHCNLCGRDDAEQRIFFDRRSVLSQTTVAIDLRAIKTYPTIVQCRKCGLVYVNPRWIFSDGILPYTEEAEEAYFAATREKRKIAFDGLIKKIQFKFQMPRFCAMDVGCGDGIILEECDRFGMQCDGFEISLSLVQRLQNQFGRQRIFSGSLDLVSERKYDVVFLINVIEHLSDPSETLNQIRRLLKPGGLLFIHAPNYGGLPARLQGTHWHQIEPLGHLYYFTQQTLEAILRKTNFQVEGNFYLKSSSAIKSTVQYLLDLGHIYLDNGLGIVARRPYND